MQISKLISVESTLNAYGICFRVEKCEDGDLFFCLSDDDVINKVRALQACKRGAVAIVTQRRLEEVYLPQYNVKDVRSSLAVASHNFYGRPSERMTVIGVTGTNGKTTTAYIIKNILEADGRKTGFIGTTEVAYAGMRFPSVLTTPDPNDLNRILFEMAEKGVDSVVMEVSAHALALRKTDGIVFSVAALTNLTPDHLDFFSDMNAYKNAKLKLFTPEHCKAAVVNVDDPLGLEIYNNSQVPLVTYGCENPSDVFGIDYKSSDNGCEFVANILDGILSVKYCGAGKFNMNNVLCACGVTSVLGVPLDAMKAGISSIKSVPGRVNIIKRGGKKIVIDYAHTPDGLSNIISTVREITAGRVITVFGCGGDRDRAKRRVMGEIASDLSDFAIITSDNPRSEPPMAIIGEIAKGIKKDNYAVEEDRELAIKRAISMCGENDTVIVAGKGHEDTQEINGARIHFSDNETVKRLLDD